MQHFNSRTSNCGARGAGAGRAYKHDDDVAAYKKWREGVLRGDTLANGD